MSLPLTGKVNDSTMSGEGLSVPTPSSTSASNLTVPSGSSAKGNQGIVRRLSQIASNFAHSSVESQLTDDAIKGMLLTAPLCLW